MERLLLILLTIVGLYFCFDLGYIITGYAHGGRILGIPLTLILILYCGLTIFTKDKKKKVFRILSYSYFLTMLTYALTILTIRENGQEDSWTYLYSMDGKADDFFIWFAIAGLLISLTIIFLTVKNKTTTR